MATTVTKTIRSSGGDYTTLSAWEAAQQGDLVAADQVRVAECYNDWPSGLSDNLTIDGSTTDSTRYLKVTVASGHRHTGVPQTGFYMKKSVTSGYFFRVDDNYTQLEWVDIENTGTSDAYAFYYTERNCSLKQCISKTSGSGNPAFYVTHLNQLIQCLAYGSSVGFYNSYVNPSFLNCVAAGNGTGFSDAGSGATVKNCVAYNNSTNYSGSSWDASSTHNATSSGSDDAPGGNSVTGVTSGAFSNAAGNNFHLSGTGSVLYNVGTSLSGTFTTDIDGDTWSNWSIGFDQVTGGGPTYTLTSAQGSFTLTGVATGLTAQRKLPVTVGSFTLTGNATGLTVQKKIAAASGSFALTGQATGLTAQRKLPVSVGSFTLTGNNATLTYTPSGATYTLTAAQGSFALTGNATAMTAQRKLAAAAGAFTLNGINVTFAKGYAMSASVGNFSLTGQAVTFTRPQRAITLSAGSFGVTGYNIDLTHSGASIWTTQNASSPTWTPATPSSPTWTEV